MSGFGLGRGFGGALMATRLMGSLVLGISATDPLTFSSMAAFLLVVAMIASLIRARRAATVDPMRVLRNQ